MSLTNLVYLIRFTYKTAICNFDFNQVIITICIILFCLFAYKHNINFALFAKALANIIFLDFIQHLKDNYIMHK